MCVHCISPLAVELNPAFRKAQIMSCIRPQDKLTTSSKLFEVKMKNTTVSKRGKQHDAITTMHDFSHFFFDSSIHNLISLFSLTIKNSSRGFSFVGDRDFPVSDRVELWWFLACSLTSRLILFPLSERVGVRFLKPGRCWLFRNK